MAEPKGVLILGEIVNGGLSPITGELLGCGRKLANQLGEPLSAALLGAGLGETAKSAVALGADTVYATDDPALADFCTEPFLEVLGRLCKETSPRVLLLGHTAIGRDLAPRLAFRLGTALATDCIDLQVDATTKSLLQTRPVYGGNALATFAVDKTYPQMSTIRSKAFAPAEASPARQGNIVAFPAALDPARMKTKYIKKVKEEVTGVKLEDAKVIVTGGRGIGSAEGFKQLEVLARLLGGAVGASRPPCDNAWVPSTIQVGLTGKIVTPDLYIAVAISGASQHLAGCSGAKNIVAINKDPEANIFKAACFGVVGDYKQIIPALTEKVKEMVGK
ncbi:MAG: electron transfer flavoprotein subunit alpha/FixB family protein [Chloroflexi bacterium]|nr:electron transfer flavoprotein subunit alpha/FixB family protein [Chloroflexota bacterium]